MLCKFQNVSFYPSIKQQHLTKAIKFAKNYMVIKDKDITLIKHSCETILRYDNRTWIKKDNNDKLGVPMGSIFDAELCDLTGLYALSNLKHL